MSSNPSPWLKPIPFFIIIYLGLFVLAGSFVLTVGPHTWHMLGQVLMAFGAGIGVISFLTTRTIPTRHTYASPANNTPATKHIGYVFMAALAAGFSGLAILLLAPP